MVAEIKHRNGHGECGCGRPATHRSCGSGRCEYCKAIEDRIQHSHRNGESDHAVRARESHIRQREHVTTHTRTAIILACDLWLDRHGTPRDDFAMTPAQHGRQAI